MTDIPAQPGKEAYVEGLFSSIAPRYDLINTVLSLARHKAWRRFAVSRTGIGPRARALDVCCGTGDFALELARAVGPGGSVVGVDFSTPMLEIARRKAARRGSSQIEFLQANACALPFSDDSFDCVAVGFGLRNVADLGTAIGEMARVTRSGGKVVSLEIVGVRSSVAAIPWRLYFDVLAPRAARVLRGRGEAYEYLSRSVRGFASPGELAAEFSKCGLRDVKSHHLALGAVCVHVGNKL